MRRDPALQGLSRDHHQALSVALRLRRAEPGAAEAFAAFWREHGEHHFQQEEQILLPAFAAHDELNDPIVAQALVEHVHIRSQASRLIAHPGDVELGRALGEALTDHVRLEERGLFPMIEAALPAAELAALAERLD